MSTPDDIHNPTSAGKCPFHQGGHDQTLEQEQPVVTGGLTNSASTF